MALYLVASAGLIVFRKWARTTFLLLNVFAIGTILLEGLTIGAPLMSFLATVWGTIQGAVLALAYAPPLGSRFA
jgi:hypothetical protein